MVIKMKNGIYKPNSNSSSGCLDSLYNNAFEKGMNPCLFSSGY